MKTKLVYILALVSLAMSSFAVAKMNQKKLKYETSSPVTVVASKESAACQSAREQMAQKGRSASDCMGKGEYDLPMDREEDSECICERPTGISDNANLVECTFGVHWYCSYDNERR